MHVRGPNSRAWRGHTHGGTVRSPAWTALQVPVVSRLLHVHQAPEL